MPPPGRTATPSLALECHPSTPTDAVSRLGVQVARAASGLTLVWVLEGTLARLRVPPPAGVRRGERLWEQTCFEAFVGAAGTSAYHELNLAPSGAWDVLAFAAYRDGGPLDDGGLGPRITVRREDGRLELEARVALDRLAPAYATVPLRLGLAAVVEASDGSRSYWALRHPPGRPDFHHADGFTVTLERSPR
jgi:hypothetical protein